jgi:macrophage erythroblast attacher
VDIELFATSRKIEDSLKKQSCTECLQWCNENKSHLRKNKSSLEFQLRVQEFVELIRGGDVTGAIQYARRNFPAWIDTHPLEIQKVMALLAFPPKSTTMLKAYKKYYEPSRWHDLVMMFRQDNYSLNQLTSQTVLAITLQAGMSALKTPQCYQQQNRNTNCPICSGPLNKLAERLPNSHHINSCIVCRISGDIMDEDNNPMVLPNGNVYSSRALQSMAASGTYGRNKIMDPRSQTIFDFGQCKKAFLT